jgi:hypothetical protein
MAQLIPNEIGKNQLPVSAARGAPWLEDMLFKNETCQSQRIKNWKYETKF